MNQYFTEMEGVQTCMSSYHIHTVHIQYKVCVHGYNILYSACESICILTSIQCVLYLVVICHLSHFIVVTSLGQHDQTIRVKLPYCGIQLDTVVPV